MRAHNAVDSDRPALGRANAVRVERAQALRRLRERACSLRELLASAPGAVAGMAAWELLAHVPRLGRDALVELNAAAISEGVNLALPIADLRPSERDWLIQAASPGRRRGRTAPNYRDGCLRLASAVRAHREHVYTAEVPDWASADDALYAALEEVMVLLAGAPPDADGA